MTAQRFQVLLPALVVAAAVVMGSVAEARAFSLFGLTLFEDQSQAAAKAVIADPRNYAVTVSVTGDQGLADAISNASALYQGRNAPASGAAGLLETARSDYRRIEAALYDAGYYGGTISILVDGSEAARLAPDSTLADPIKVAIQVATGPQFLFGKAEIVNAAPVSAGTDSAMGSLQGIGFAAGKVARAGTVRQAALIAVEAWRQKGYPKAKVASQQIVADHRTNRLDAVLTVSPGPYAVIGVLSVDGAKTVDTGFIVRQAGLVPGKPFDPGSIVRARERLAGLDLFSSIKIAEADKVDANGTLPLTILVQERKPRRIGVGANFSTTDGLGLETYFLHRNLFGQGERLKLTAKLAGIAYPVNSADFDYYFGGTFTKPGIITPDTDLVADLTAQRTVLTHYTETSIDGRLGLSQRFSKQLSAEAGIEFKQGNFYDTLYGTRDFSVFSTYGSVTYDTRDNPTDATKGIYASLTAEPFYEAQYGNPALLLEGETRGYLGFGDGGRFVLAGRLKAGLLFGPSIAETPPDMLFFAGGGGSVRGYAYRSIGVAGPGGTVTGGKFLTEASLEARLKLNDTYGVVGFADAGYVTADNFVGLGEGTRVGVGVGLRYYTGFGPLRLDFAVPLNKRPGDADFALYAGIGQAF